MGNFHAAWTNSELLAQLQRWFTDEFRDLREIQRMIAKQSFGGRIPSNMDAHGQENLRHGAYQDARAHAEERYIAPISRILSKAGLNIDQFSDYLWWRHAPERDAYLRKNLDPAIAATVGPADLAGISPADARANIAALDPADRKAFERAAKFIDGMRKFTLETKLASGEISQDHFDGVTKQYDKYVPLRGLPDEMQDLIDQSAPGSGRGVSMSAAGTGKRPWTRLASAAISGSPAFSIGVRSTRTPNCLAIAWTPMSRS